MVRFGFWTPLSGRTRRVFSIGYVSDTDMLLQNPCILDPTLPIGMKPWQCLLYGSLACKTSLVLKLWKWGDVSLWLAYTSSLWVCEYNETSMQRCVLHCLSYLHLLLFCNLVDWFSFLHLQGRCKLPVLPRYLVVTFSLLYSFSVKIDYLLNHP